VTSAFDLRGRRALVTGADRGAGRATAVALAAAGAAVVACYLSDDAPDGLAARLVRADVTRPEGVAVAVDACRTHLGAVEIVVNASDTPDWTPIRAVTPAGWQQALDRTLTAPLLVTQGVLPLLPAGASVVNIGATAAATTGLTGLTRSLAKELGPDGVRVNLVAVGPAVADRTDDVAAVALFLASDAAAGVNGETFTVDGGV
jgi:NAD(P)-dependent dehydrogenase (short-subunit alcohol dehydrogenase family)